MALSTMCDAVTLGCSYLVTTGLLIFCSFSSSLEKTPRHSFQNQQRNTFKKIFGAVEILWRHLLWRFLTTSLRFCISSCAFALSWSDCFNFRLNDSLRARPQNTITKDNIKDLNLAHTILHPRFLLHHVTLSNESP